MSLRLLMFQVKPEFEDVNNAKKNISSQREKKNTIYGIGIYSFLN